ncbi:MAG: transporter [Alphaproteobacteria bacterium]
MAASAKSGGTWPALRFGAVASLALFAAMPAFAAPQTFNTALPVTEDEFVFRQQFLNVQASGDPTAANREVEVLGAVSVLGYGVDPDFTLFAILPYFDKKLELTTSSGQRISREARGIGDLSVMARYTVYKDNFPGGNFRIAPFAGIQIPTGENSARDRFGRIPPPIQPGSGSWNPFAGIVTTYQTLDFEFDADAVYQVNTTTDGFRAGNVVRFDASLQYRLWPRELGPGVPGFLYGVLETNVIYQDKDRILGAGDPNSGGTSWFLDPGIQYVTKNYVLEAIVQVPLTQDLNGSALENDYTILAGIRVNL